MGFTLIEALVVAAITLLLVGLLLAGLAVVREGSRRQAVQIQLTLLTSAMETYRNEDGERRYPPQRVDLTLSDRDQPGEPGVLGIMDRRGYYAPGAARWDDHRRLLDPWGAPYRYSLSRPTVATPIVRPEWNWNATANRERRWGRRRDPLSGIVADGPLPFAYLWSLGSKGTEADPTTWIHLPDAG